MGGGTKNDEPRRLSDIREDPSASRNFKVAATRVGHAKQLKGTYAKVENDLVEYLGLNPEHMSIDGSLEHFLGLEDNKTASVEEIETKIHSLLPHIAKGYADCISCGRLKDVRRLAAKLETEDRDTHDVWGTQYWLADPNLMDKLVKLESPQHPLRKKWAEKGFDVTFDNHCSEPKSHGYRAFHINITCPGNNAWKEDAEFQFFPSTMMLPYFSTRGAYEAYRNIEEYVIHNKGKNEQNWDDKERFLVHTLRDSINAQFEEGAHKAKIMDMVNSYHKNQPIYNNAEDANLKAEELRPTVELIVNTMLSYENEVRLVLRDFNALFSENELALEQIEELDQPS
tara:strand:- start:410 stop:1432 length:1023 start_codon:yes stop_codon:yes gene_type:complete